MDSGVLCFVILFPPVIMLIMVKMMIRMMVMTLLFSSRLTALTTPMLYPFIGECDPEEIHVQQGLLDICLRCRYDQLLRGTTNRCFSN